MPKQPDLDPGFRTLRMSNAQGEVVHVFGEADLTVAEQLEAAIDDAASAGRSVLIDLARCQYIDSTCLRTIVVANKRIAPRLTLHVQAQSHISKIVSIMSLDKVLRVVTDREASNKQNKAQ